MHIQEKDEMELRPVFTEEGITYIYIKVSQLTHMQPSLDHAMWSRDDIDVWYMMLLARHNFDLSTMLFVSIFCLCMSIYLSIYLLLVVQQLTIASGDEKEFQRSDDLILPIQVNHGECIMV